MEFLFVGGLAACLIGLSAICSGLNVALLSLDVADLKRKAKLGSRTAATALSIRENAHFYLAGILLANVAFASATPIVLNGSFSGIIAGIISTLLLVVFAEIAPQAIAVRAAMRAIAFFAPAIKVVTYIAYPITKSLQLLLNRLLGSPADYVLHSRHELGLLIADHQSNRSELDEDEVEIVRGALQLSEKTVAEIMTPLSKVYHLTEGMSIDAKKIDELKYESWSRIPILNRRRTRCSSFLMLKDLVDVDFDERPIPLIELPVHKAYSIGSKTALDTLFRTFISVKRHMLIVTRGGKIDGIVTIEDLLEEIIGHEIEDESDTDSRNGKNRRLSK